jgi:hypothetical protein
LEKVGLSVREKRNGEVSLVVNAVGRQCSSASILSSFRCPVTPAMDQLDSSSLFSGPGTCDFRMLSVFQNSITRVRFGDQNQSNLCGNWRFRKYPKACKKKELGDMRHHRKKGFNMRRNSVQQYLPGFFHWEIKRCSTNFRTAPRTLAHVYVQ